MAQQGFDMRFGIFAVTLCAAWSLSTGVAGAQNRPLMLPDVLARAREQAPRIAGARLTLGEAQGRLVGASLRLQANPQLDAAIGSRRSGDHRSTDLELGLGQTFEPAARRSARIAAANAAIAQGSANVDEITRLVLREAASAYYRALHAAERIRWLATTEELAVGVYQAADRRFRAGDIAILDINIARASLARTRAEREAAAASEALALGDLRQVLGIDGDITVGGSLRAPTTELNLSALLELALQRPELRQLEAAVREAEAEVQLGHSFSKPDYGFGVRYEREQQDQILFGGLTLTFPVFSKGQELRAVGSARATRLRAELDAARAGVQIEVQARVRSYERRLQAIRLLEMDALPGLDENETLVTRSFEVGQLGLPALLLIRREILDTRFQYLDALLEAALARLDLDASAAILR
jgi:outer membrane protein, heavy metal efflux system